VSLSDIVWFLAGAAASAAFALYRVRQHRRRLKEMVAFLLTQQEQLALASHQLLSPATEIRWQTNESQDGHICERLAHGATGF
jgi:hypothetical protein